jgi:hypothetical protein
MEVREEVGGSSARSKAVNREASAGKHHACGYTHYRPLLRLALLHQGPAFRFVFGGKLIFSRKILYVCCSEPAVGRTREKKMKREAKGREGG